MNTKHIRAHAPVNSNVISPSSEPPKSAVLRAALAWASRGFRVFPLSSPTASGACSCSLRGRCTKAGKHPNIKDWTHQASADSEQIQSWWALWPNANLGLLTGDTGRLFALDIDGEGGRASLADLVKRYGPLPTTVAQRTGSGGAHYLFRVPDQINLTGIPNSAGKIASKLDVRCRDGYIVVAPSVHRSGARYAWTSPRGTPIATLPTWLYSLAKEEKKDCQGEALRKATPQAADTVERARKLLATVPPAIQGAGGSTVTFKAAVALVKGLNLNPDTALELLLSEYNPKCQPPWSRGELEHKIQSAIGAKHLAPGYLLNGTGVCRG